MSNYGIDDGEGNSITQGLQGLDHAREVAAREAQERGEVVSLYGPGIDDCEIIPPTVTATTPATISTAKGGHTGTLQECVEWQAEMQGSLATISAAEMVIDVDDVDFDAEDIDSAMSEVFGLFAAEIA